MIFEIRGYESFSRNGNSITDFVMKKIQTILIYSGGISGLL